MPYMNGEEPVVGDRVQVMHEMVDGHHRWPPIGREGTVISLGHSDRVSVEFEEASDCVVNLGRHAPLLWSCIVSCLDPAGEPAFYLVEPHEGAFRPIPDGPTFSDGKRAAIRAKQLSAERGIRIQVRPIAKDIEISGWREREEKRLTDGTYAPMPWGWDLPAIDSHFLHLAKEDLKMVAFTESPEKGVLDRQTRLTPGRYLERFHGDLSETQRARYVAFVDAPLEVHFTDAAKRIQWVYRHGPDSCMAYAKSHYASKVHPVEVYAGGDLSLAYLTKTRGLRVSARALVWRERKIYGRIYGDTARMEKALDALGYRPGGYNRGLFAGARIRKIWDAEEESYVMPYLDGYIHAVDDAWGDREGFLTILGPYDDGEGKAGRVRVVRSQNGIAKGLYRWCAKARSWFGDPDAFARMHGESEDWSLSALQACGAQVPHPETGETVWWPQADLIRLSGTWRFKADVADRYFISDYSREAFDNAELHLLEDGRKVSQSEFRRHGFT